MGLTNTEIVTICFYFVIFVMGVIGNGLVIFVTSYKMKTTVNSTWFLNLAIADFILMLSLIFNIILKFHKYVWTLGNFMCKFTSFISMQNTFASAFFLTVISLDRCMCTCLVVWAQNKRTLVKARIICVFVWLLSMCCSIPFAIFYSVQELYGFKFCGPVLSRNVFTSLSIYVFTMGFLIPFLIIISSYIAIGVRVKHLKSFRIISVILAFFICSFPYHVLHLYVITALKNKWRLDGAKILVAGLVVTGLSYLNSCLNPILYVFMSDEFKKKIKRSLLLVLEGAFTEDHLSSR
ncbi:C3a anaphylatoxin chemotactic receptor-like [Triplophysa dalaica]|uniref:C3a anaphylatoxin chemotactic receptor-like n=1 Tax=Triplophysa dalaica TaxID=1582913 RepID=UPI0024DFC990|nr:C3a anaphylatoxin chemotactic receptor-like [Triplophysa dalaica]